MSEPKQGGQVGGRDANGHQNFLENREKLAMLEEKVSVLEKERDETLAENAELKKQFFSALNLRKDLDDALAKNAELKTTIQEKVSSSVYDPIIIDLFPTGRSYQEEGRNHL